MIAWIDHFTTITASISLTSDSFASCYFPSYSKILHLFSALRFQFDLFEAIVAISDSQHLANITKVSVKILIFSFEMV